MKRQKMNLSDMLNIGIEYHAFARVYSPVTSKKKNLGTLYVLSKPLTEDQKTFVLGWKNTTIGTAQSKSAPEIKYNTVTVWDKCLRED